MNQQVLLYSPWGVEMHVNASPEAFTALGLNIRSGEKLLPIHDDKVGPLVSVVGVGSDSGTPTGKTVIWCQSEGKKQKGEPVFFFPDQFPELFRATEAE